ncbi:MAG: hypothetical protein LC722_03790 [Actinobacteria bacterium]|nr:hypothetical protein [Actinomycetota bacterium]
MHRRIRILAVVAVFALVGAACGSDNPADTNGPGAGPSNAASDIRVGVAFDVGGVGDKSFNDAAVAGYEAAIAEGLISEANVTTIEPNATGSNRDANIQNLADQGFDLILAPRP